MIPTKYQQRLADLAGIELEQDKRPHLDFEDHIDATYRTLTEMLEEQGPQLISDVAVEFEPVLGNTSNLKGKLKQRPTWITQIYGIELMVVNDAIELTYGNFEKLQFTRKPATLGRTHIFYLDEKSLKKYIRAKTRKKVMILADF